MTDALQLVRTLNPDDIRARLEELGRERAALMVLLRAARGVGKRVSRPPEPVDSETKSRKAVRE